jgi:hypothetical protein
MTMPNAAAPIVQHRSLTRPGQYGRPKGCAFRVPTADNIVRVLRARLESWEIARRNKTKCRISALP